MKPKTNRRHDPPMDHCQTPSYALAPILPYIQKDWIVWECACGEFSLSNAFLGMGYNTIATDILYGQDFFQYEPCFDCIVTNPPYSIKYAWLERCYDLGKPFALLMPVEMLGAAKAQKLFKETTDNTHGLELILLNRRVNFKMPIKGWKGAGAQFPVAWYTWKLDIRKQITFADLS